MIRSVKTAQNDKTMAIDPRFFSAAGRGLVPAMTSTSLAGQSYRYGGPVTCLISFRAAGRSQEPAGDRPHYQLPASALGAGGGRRQALQHPVCAGGRRDRERGECSESITLEPLAFPHTFTELLIDPLQTRVSGMSTNTMLRDLQPDTEYRVTLVPVYSDVEGKQVSENGKTSECSKKDRILNIESEVCVVTGTGSSSVLL